MRVQANRPVAEPNLATAIFPVSITEEFLMATSKTAHTDTSSKSAGGKSGDAEKKAGAGPALAAHSKDASSKAASGQNPDASGKKKS